VSGLRTAARLACRAALLLAALAGFAAPAPAREPSVAFGTVALADLPPEARQTVRLIQRGGPFPYDRDGVAFRNFERHLPLRERGYYREYTVPMPGARNRGVRRIVAGRGGELYYTDDHYRSFRRVRE
jgi:ribonuclease T1